MFLASFVASSTLPDVSQLVAEYQRLYATALDAMATAERGVLISHAEDGTEIREVSLSAQLKAVREARTTLDRLTTLAVARESGAQTPESADTALAARIAAALDRIAERSAIGAPNHVTDAELVEDVLVEGDPGVSGAATREVAPTPGADRQAASANGSPLTP